MDQALVYGWPHMLCADDVLDDGDAGSAPLLAAMCKVNLRKHAGSMRSNILASFSLLRGVILKHAEIKKLRGELQHVLLGHFDAYITS